MNNPTMDAWVLWGAFCFGLVIGWVTYRTLRRSSANGISDIATVIGAVGGATVTKLFTTESGAFGRYCVGLAVGFFVYLIVSLFLAKHTGNLPVVNEWLGENPRLGSRGSNPDPLEPVAPRK